MGVVIGDVLAFVPNAIPDLQRAQSHIDQQGNMRVAQIVNADGFHSRLCRILFYPALQEIRLHREHPIPRPPVIAKAQILLHFTSQPLRQPNHPHTFLCLRRGNNILSMKAVVGLADGHRSVFKIKILRRQCQQLTLPNPCPVQHLKTVVGHGLLHARIGKGAKLLQRPKIAFPLPGGADPHDPVHGIVMKAVILGRIAKQNHQLGVEIAQIVFGKGSARPFVAMGKQHILPPNDLRPCDLVHPPPAEIRQDPFREDGFLGDE